MRLINGVGTQAGQFWVMQILPAQVAAPPACSPALN